MHHGEYNCNQDNNIPKSADKARHLHVERDGKIEQDKYHQINGKHSDGLLEITLQRILKITPDPGVLFAGEIAENISQSSRRGPHTPQHHKQICNHKAHKQVKGHNQLGLLVIHGPGVPNGVGQLLCQITHELLHIGHRKYAV